MLIMRKNKRKINRDEEANRWSVARMNACTEIYLYSFIQLKNYLVWHNDCISHPIYTLHCNRWQLATSTYTTIILHHRWIGFSTRDNFKSVAKTKIITRKRRSGNCETVWLGVWELRNHHNDDTYVWFLAAFFCETPTYRKRRRTIYKFIVHVAMTGFECDLKVDFRQKALPPFQFKYNFKGQRKRNNAQQIPIRQSFVVRNRFYPFDRNIAGTNILWPYNPTIQWVLCQKVHVDNQYLMAWPLKNDLKIDNHRSNWAFLQKWSYMPYKTLQHTA